MKVVLILIACGVFSFFVVGANEAVSAEQGKACATPDSKLMALIEESQSAGDVWQMDDCDSVRHLQSGVTCSADLPLDESALERLVEFPTGLGLGEDVACDYSLPDGGALTLYVTRDADPRDSESEFQGVVDAIAQRFERLKPLQPPIMSGPIPAEAEPIEPLTASFEFEMEDGRKAVTSAWYYVLHDWQVKIRLTEFGTSADEASMGQLTGGLMMILALTNVSEQAMNNQRLD